jgi:hypothetical protein
VFIGGIKMEKNKKAWHLRIDAGLYFLKGGSKNEK